jgi:hypothetical protein
MFLRPIAPPYDPLVWERLPFPEKARQVCLSWALQGYGTPIGVYLVYLLKLLGYVGGWLWFCGFTPGMGGLADIGSWWLTAAAFEKAILWSMLFELLGLGCGSGPLTGRYVPPIGGLLYFLRPGTTKLPLIPGAPLIGGIRRNAIDVLGYAGVLALLVLGLVAARPEAWVLVALAVCVPVLGVLDKTLFLAARGEHYWTAIVIFALAGATEAGFVPGMQWLWAALWFWAGVSKLNHHFPAVVGVMMSNNPFVRFEWLRRRMYRDYPEDMGASRLATWMAHAGTFLELSVPILLMIGGGGPVTLVGMALMLMLHGFILSNVPMGVPIEWNVVMVYGGFYLFWDQAGVSPLAVGPAVAAVVAVMGLALPVLGNLVPGRVSFLLAMRYYAGNWPYSVWLLRGESHVKLERLRKSSGWVHEQLGLLYDRATCVALIGKVMAFRLMHLHGRVLPGLLPRAVERIEDYQWMDGELIAGLALGWNFGDGHLHGEQLLGAIQEQCGFAAGELRVIMVESQPLGRGTLAWRIWDAKDGLMESGEAAVAELRGVQPWG